MANRKPSRSAIIGYPYQQQVYSLLVAKMDVDEKFVCVEIEKDLDDSSISNFDDCYLEYDSNKYYFQVKNLSKNGEKATLEDIKFHEDKITLFGSDMKFNKENTNILIVYTDKIQTTTQIFGLDAILKNGIYIVPLTIPDISNYLDDLFSDENRARVITEFALEKSSSSIFKITRYDLPLPQKLFSHELEEETRILRNIIPEIETGILMVIGKPGVGKSHFVNEIADKFKHDGLYRFWISSTDDDLENRLQFNNFIKELCIDVFKSSAKFNETQLIDKINSEELTIIIDGLDHVENYNPIEFNKFVEFINKCQNGKILVLSRPLKNDLDWDKINLENWDYDETRKYFEEEYGCEDFDLISDIYEISDGYPIISKLIYEHYLLYDEIPETHFSEVNEYYDELFNFEDVKSAMSIFLINTYFITHEELKLFLDEFGYAMVYEFIRNHRYLFSIDLNRISLIHDSLNTYLRENNTVYKSMEKNILETIKENIKNFEVNYLSRFNGFNFDEGFIKEILLLFSKFDSFEKLLNNTFDFESIQEFYLQLEQALSRFPNLFNICQYYSFILISLILKRKSFGWNNKILYQIYSYMDNNSLDEKDIFSKKTFWNDYKYFKYIKTGIVSNFSFFKKMSTSEQIELNESFLNERHYWDELEEYDEDEYVNQIISTSNPRQKRDLLQDLFVKIKYNEDSSSQYYSVIDGFIDDDLKSIENNIKHIFLDFKIPFDLIPTFIKSLELNLKSLGIIANDNIFLEEDISNLISKNAKYGSFAVEDYILRYLRLKNRKNDSIDLNSINKFYCMYFERKDYTVISIHKALLTFEDKGYLDELNSFDIILNLLKQSEKGIRELLEDYINLKEPTFIKKLLKYRTFPHDESNIFNLKPKYINEFPVNDICSAWAFRFRYCTYGTSIEYYRVKNLMKSKYKIPILEMMNYNKLSLENVPKKEEYLINGKKIKYTIKKREHKSKYIPFKDGTISLNDLNHIKKTKMSPIDISQYTDGWYHAFHYLELYEHYPIEELQECCLDIIHTSMFVKIHSYFNSWDYYLGNLPIFLNKIDYDVDWDEIFEIFKNFLKFSSIFINV